MVTTTTTTTTYTRTPFPSPTKAHTPLPSVTRLPANSVSTIPMARPIIPQHTSSGTRSQPMGSRSSRNTYPSLSTLFAPAGSLCAPKTLPKLMMPLNDVFTDQSTSTLAPGLCLPPSASPSTFKRSHQRVSPSKHGTSKLSPSKGSQQLSRVMAPPLVPLHSKHSSSSSTQMSLADCGYARRYSRIICPSNLARPKIGIDAYHVVVCGQEVGIFYAL